MRKLTLKAAILAAAAALALPVLHQSAFAQVSPKPGPKGSVDSSIAGDWLFDTSTFQGDCMIKGVMTLRPTALANTYSCVFESEQICGKQNNEVYIRVRQTCTAQKIGQQVAIKSEVARILEARDADGPYPSAYLADNFIVTLQKKKAEMLGDHYDEQRTLKARFWRDAELIS